MDRIRLQQCDFNIPEQRDAYLTLLSQYMINPMGGMDHGLDEEQQCDLVRQLSGNPMCRCFLLADETGMSDCPHASLSRLHSR